MRSVRFMLVAMLVLTGLARAQDPTPTDPRIARDQIAAATSRALEALRGQVSAEPVIDGVSVQDLLDKTNGNRKLMQTLRRAQQIGGPRWLDSQTCQVRLEIGGPMVANALYVIAATDNRTPVPPDVVKGRLQRWNTKTFSATGTSTGAAAVEQALADAVHKQAVCDARIDAVNQVLQQVRPIPMTKNKTVADALALPGVRDEVEKWLNDRPVTQVEFREAQQQARVTLAVAGDELFDTFQAAASKQANAIGPMDEAAWGHVHDEFVSRVGPASGRALAKGSAGTAAPVAIPATPPAWVDQQIQAEGSSGAKTSRLKAARAAESDASRALRAKVEPLALSPGMTLGDAARQDKRVDAAIERALVRGARTLNVDYAPDGSAKVSVALDLKDLWQEIAELP
jgi:hypothetical protein